MLHFALLSLLLLAAPHKTEQSSPLTSGSSKTPLDFETVASDNIEYDEMPNPSPSVVYPSQFCGGLPTGSYCNIDFPREIVQCPSAVSVICPEQHVCRETSIGESGVYAATCVRNVSVDEAAKCSLVPPGKTMSKCLDDHSVIECPRMTKYRCPEDMVCQRRGLRAFCIKKNLADIPVEDFDSCKGVSGDSQDVKICDALNLRRVLKCPSRESYQCANGLMCGTIVTGSSKTEAGCIPWEQNLIRFCSNKPLYSTHCIPNDKTGRFIICGFQPSVYQCPSETPRCFQELSITARCRL